MIPRIDWFFHSTARYEAVSKSTLPTVMIGTLPGILLYEGYLARNFFALPDLLVGSGFRYGRDVSGYELKSTSIILTGKSVHQFHDYYGKAYMNTTGSFQRPLDGAWTGATRITTTTQNSRQSI